MGTSDLLPLKLKTFKYILGKCLNWKITKEYQRENKNNRIVGNVFSHKWQKNLNYILKKTLRIISPCSS